ncbi:hypothetical protein J437_LFUL011302 [Ladona fulva]|uniref:Uncharacterized protein n=1 Tax=Ladona fulva TaxID=123851 RepID=A0A8K0KLI0_LADFU|nr:hypothetical protein J437_LFUL011302 [Ladona fulva]
MHRSYYESSRLNDFMFCNNLYLVLSDPTHHTERSHTLIDLCFVDDLEKVVDNSQYSVPILSAHDLIRITYNFSSSRGTLMPIISRDIKHFDKSLYQQDLFSADWSTVFASNSMECKLEAFNSNLMNSINLHAPLHTRSLKRPPAPWLTEDNQKLIKERNKLSSPYVRSQSLSVLSKYKTCRNVIKSLIIESKKRQQTADGFMA